MNPRSEPLYHRLLLMAVLLLVAVPGLSGCSGAADLTPEEHIAQAKEYHDKGELRAAAIELKNALQQEPNNFEARRQLGRIYLDTGDGKAAEKELRRAVDLGLTPEAAAIPLAKALLLQGEFQDVLDSPVAPQSLPKPGQATLLALRGHAQIGLRDFDAAGELYETALSMSPDEPEAGLGKARLAAAQGELAEARASLDKVLQTHVGFAPAWSLLGDIERYEQNAEKAEDAYGKAITYLFDNTIDLLNRAMVRIYQSDYDGAASDLETVEKRASAHPLLAYTQGLWELEQKKYAEAQAAFQRALSRAPDLTSATYYLAVSYYMLGQFEQADHHATHFWNRFPQSDAAAKLLGTIRYLRADYPGAESFLRTVLARTPNDSEALNLMGEIALRQGKPEEGVERLEKVVALNPDSAAAYMKLGLGLIIEDEDEAAVEALGRAVEIDPELQQATLLGIVTQLKANRWDDAIAALESLLAKQPDASDALTLMGVAYIGKRDEDNARQAFRRALEIAPHNSNAADNLARLELRAGNTREARRLYEDQLRWRPAHLTTLLSLVQLDQSEGKIEDAMRRLESAVKEHPDAVQPKVSLSGYYLQFGQPERVLDLMRNLEQTQADNAYALGVVGEAQLALNQPRNAAATFEKLVKAAPRSARAHLLLAKAHAKLNHPDKVREELEKALANNPNHLPSKVALARLAMEEGKPEDANRLLTELATTYPRDPKVLELQGWLAARQGRSQDAVTAFREAVELTQSSSLLVQLAAAQSLANDPDGSLATLEDWLSEHPTDTLARYHLANFHLLRAQHGKASAAFQKVVDQSPDHVLALNNLAWLLRDDDPEKALEYARRAQRLAPDAPVIMDTLGTLLLNQGDANEAIRLLRDASTKAPGDLEIRYHLAQALAAGGNDAEARRILMELVKSGRRFENRQDAVSLLKSLDG